MKAVVLSTYGPPDVVQIHEVQRPVPKDHEVLIKIHAASVNPLDRSGMRGMPYLARLMGGLRQPRDKRLGVDVAGQVEAVGRDVTQFKPGDAVFGMCKGAFAEYACAPAIPPPEPLAMSVLALKPEQVTFEQAASAPVAGFSALQGLRDKGRLKSGQKVLINGAAGGVGTFAVQIARSFGAEVTGVCSTGNLDLVRSLGADHVIDYTRENFTTNPQRYDLLLDCAGNHSLFACARVLNPRGTHVVVGAPHHGRWLGPLARLFKALLLSRFVSHNLIVFIAKPSKADLITIGELIATGKVTPVIGKLYPLSQVPDAMRHLETGHARGKIIITLE